MSASVIHLLLEVAIAISAAILAVAALRKIVRYAAGARAAYWLWLLVPASALAAVLPAPARPLMTTPTGFASLDIGALSAGAESHTGSDIDYWSVALLLWSLGAVLMSAFVIGRQRTFLASLGKSTPETDGLQRSAALAGPVLVGVWRPRVVVPADFEARYGAEERTLMLAHEEAHRERGDAIVNAIATGALSLLWFNPLVYWALERLRIDQELACDELVFSRFKTGRRRYADALLKTQLAAESNWRIPVGCAWQSNHPLKERIAMLKRPLPTIVRRSFGIAAAFALIGPGSYAVWAMQPGKLAEVPMTETAQPFTISADHTSIADDGATLLAGDVVLNPSHKVVPPKISADSTHHDAKSGAMVFDGNVSIEIGDRVITTDRAILASDGTIQMDAARNSLRAAEKERQTGKRFDYNPSSDPARANEPALVSAEDLARWFPAEAARAGVEGIVTIAVTLDEAGRPTDATVVSESPTGYGFAAVASTAARFFKYRNPTGAPATLTFSIKFALDQSTGAKKL